MSCVTNMESINLKNSIKYKCDTCEKDFTAKSSLNKHKIDYHSDEANKVHKCELCDKEFATGSTLKDHNKKIHQPIKKWHFCDQCDFKAKDKWHLNSHRDTHDKSIFFKCDLCEVTLTTKWKLASHKLKIHSENRERLNCDHCDYTCVEKSSLQCHVNAKHLIIGAINCSCFDRFA